MGSDIRAHFFMVKMDCEHYGINPLEFESFCNKLDLGDKCSDCYGIVHHDEINKNGELERVHVHFAVRFNSSVRVSFVAKIFGCEVQDVNVSKVKHSSFAYTVQYLTHKNDDSKKQYSTDDVIVLLGDFDFWYNKSKADIQSDLESECTTLQSFKNAVTSAIVELNNENKLLNSTNLLLTLRERYSHAYDYYLVNQKSDATLRKLVDDYYLGKKSGSRTCVFLFGEARSGKSDYSRKLATELFGDSVYYTSNKRNALDGYNYEKCIVFNDFPYNNNLVMTYKEFCDFTCELNHNDSFSARYKDKNLCNLEYVIFNCDTDCYSFARLYQDKFPNLYTASARSLSFTDKANLVNIYREFFGRFASFIDIARTDTPLVSLATHKIFNGSSFEVVGMEDYVVDGVALADCSSDTFEFIEADGGFDF